MRLFHEIYVSGTENIDKKTRSGDPSGYSKVKILFEQKIKNSVALL